MNQQYSIAVIGAGAMGGAVANGLLASGFDASRITIANPHTHRLEPLAQAGCITTTDNLQAIHSADLVIIAVKPWILPAVAAQLRSYIQPTRQEVALIVAGIPGRELTEMFTVSGTTPALSIVMPNTAIALRRSMTFMVELNGKCPLAHDAFSRLGSLMSIEERLLPAATALASCGIAYALRYIRAAVEGGVELGFRAADAQAIVAATVAGAAALLGKPEAHAEAEIDKVTTPGGITIRGLNAMEAAGFTPAVIAGLRASANKTH